MTLDIRAQAQQNGYVLLRDLLSPDLGQALTRGVEDALGTQTVTPRSPMCFGLGHFPRTPRLWPLLHHQPLTDALTDFLGTSPVLLPSVDTIAVNGSETGPHRDSSYDALPSAEGDNDPRYGIVRAIFYPSREPDRGSNEFLVAPGSHLPGWEKPDDVSSAMTPLAIGPCDAVLFDARLVHAGAPHRHTKHLLTLTFGPDNVLSQETHTHEMKNLATMGFETDLYPGFGTLLDQTSLAPRWAG